MISQQGAQVHPKGASTHGSTLQQSTQKHRCRPGLYTTDIRSKMTSSRHTDPLWRRPPLFFSFLSFLFRSVFHLVPIKRTRLTWFKHGLPVRPRPPVLPFPRQERIHIVLQRDQRGPLELPLPEPFHTPFALAAGGRVKPLRERGGEFVVEVHVVQNVRELGPVPGDNTRVSGG